MTIDSFYKEIKEALLSYEDSVVKKEFVNKSTPIEEIPINTTKEKVMSVK